jgi:hypothetical protein
MLSILTAMVLAAEPSPQAVWLGVVVEPSLRNSIRCAEVITTVPRSPSAGVLQPGDCIERADGLSVFDNESLAGISSKHKAGDVLTLVLSGGRNVSLANAKLPASAREMRCASAQSAVARITVHMPGKVEPERLRFSPSIRISDVRRRTAGARELPFILVSRRNCVTGADESIVDARDSAELLDEDEVFFLRSSKLGCARSLGDDGGLRVDCD